MNVRTVNSLVLTLDEQFKFGLTCRIVIKCSFCDETGQEMSSKCIRNTSIGRGKASGKIFSEVMNLSPPNTKFEKYNSKILAAVTEVCEASMKHAAKEALQKNEGRSDVSAAFDCTWQKQGHTSMNGVVTVTSFYTGKVLDFECLSKFCTGCFHKINVLNPEKIEEHKNVRAENYKGSSGCMEVAGATALCARSEHKLGLHYVQYLGDEDSKGFAAVLQNKPYGNNVNITELEGVGHLQKRDIKGQKLSDGKGFAGKGRLTDAEIDHLQCSVRLNSLPEAVRAAIKPVFMDLFKICLLMQCLHRKTQNPNESFNSTVWQRLPKKSTLGSRP
ncbi:hypothetical protein PR048_028577 [Dryococelus australis]|uniref:Mutator-like transposase domain-containing protein n=1 Tax=Dryococelus australis TaxID=614101 RepID=A0ABQ9GAY6_9NEOP|nr:hypothetical protein PR048_028577 [Dryococelus australis]